MKFTRWALEQITDRSPTAGGMVGPSVQDLVNAVFTLRGTRGSQIFGLAADKLEPEGRPAVEAAAIEALVAWRAHFEAERDQVSLLALDQAGVALALPALRLTQRVALRCDPLGTRDGLAADWLARLARLDAAIAGRRTLDAGAVHHVLADQPVRVAFGAPDEPGLYTFALRFEATERTAFPRPLAALWSTANGIALYGDPVLRPIADWSREDDGWCIGCGGYDQGALTVAVTAKRGLLDAPVIDRDDDGVERARYANLGGWCDALLGA